MELVTLTPAWYLCASLLCLAMAVAQVAHHYRLPHLRSLADLIGVLAGVGMVAIIIWR